MKPEIEFENILYDVIDILFYIFGLKNPDERMHETERVCLLLGLCDLIARKENGKSGEDIYQRRMSLIEKTRSVISRELLVDGMFPEKKGKKS